MPIAALTAWVGLFKHGHLEPGDDVLIQGGGGSIFALQPARAAGNRVIALFRSREKGARIMKLGASDVIDSMTHVNWEAQVRVLTNGKGVANAPDS